MLRPASEVIDEVLGSEYEPRGRGPDRYDCLGLFLHVAREAFGVELDDPGVSDDGIAEAIERFRVRFEEVSSIDDAKPCDLVHVVARRRIGLQHVLIVESRRRGVEATRHAGVRRVSLESVRRLSPRVWRLRCFG